MANLQKFLPRLQLRLIDCPDVVAIDALRMACIEFCTKTLWWTYEPEPMPLAVGASTYPVDTPAGTVPVMIVDAWANGLRMTPESEESISAKASEWRERTGTPTAYLQYSPSEMVVAPVPDERIEEGLKLLVALRPSQTGDEVDDSIFEYHYDTIVAGALAELFSHAGRPYSNPVLVPDRRVAFADGISDAKAARQRGFTRGPLRVQMRRW